MDEEETAHYRTLVKRASKPNKKITKASQLLPVHSLLSNVFVHKLPLHMWAQEEQSGVPHVPVTTAHGFVHSLKAMLWRMDVVVHLHLNFVRVLH